MPVARALRLLAKSKMPQRLQPARGPLSSGDQPTHEGLGRQLLAAKPAQELPRKFCQSLVWGDRLFCGPSRVVCFLHTSAGEGSRLSACEPVGRLRRWAALAACSSMVASSVNFREDVRRRRVLLAHQWWRRPQGTSGRISAGGSRVPAPGSGGCLICCAW